MLHVGTSGWQYADWRGRFYPETLPQRRWLGHYAETFTTVEVNSTFYRLPQRSTFAGWADVVPTGFTMAVKMSRYLTHIRRLSDPSEPVARFLDRATALGDHLGPVLLQLPPNLPARPDALDATLREFPAATRVVVEPRHDSWWCDEVRDVMSRRGAALCWADRRSRVLTPLWKTAGFGYVRLHEGRGTPATSYGIRALDAWLGRIGDSFDTGEDVYIYFNNDAGGAAVANARTLLRRSGSGGHPG
ncbi:DUF72 domain-containing protein [Gordonia rhizosphera]|uniref:DUF72 domain-containing protein n=1 Tax=Gordonia rhizosphera NBRC 16068 TaxID=1108045 RepID=K6WYK6_9ACTN|nr:DUF72 domain-containing protein [Gordonia rhizosphera]GAB91644.1 hypothetical protein GORHZ_141_00190 [Gordonia rhizosphera NBRC 16068]